MMLNLFKNNKYFLILLIYLGFLLPVCAESETTQNILHKIELQTAENNTLFVKLHTTEKYSMLPSPIKKEGTGYVIFLPQTVNGIKTDISSIILNTPVEDIAVEYFPGENSNIGYTKIFLKTSDKEINLSIENPIFGAVKLPEQTKEPVFEKTEENVEQQTEQQVEEQVEEKAEKQTEELVEEQVENSSDNIPITEETNTEVIVIKQERPKPEIIIQNIATKDYSVGITVALALLVLNLIFFARQNKNRLKNDGELAKILKKKVANFSECDYLLLLSDNEEMIDRVCDICLEERVNLHIASANTAGLVEKYANEHIDIKILDFKLDEFYKHKDFYKNLNPKPLGIIIDLSNKYPQKDSAKEFSFIDIKKYIDANFTNLYIILNLTLADIDKNNGFIIFTEPTKQLISPAKNKLYETFYLSTNYAIGNLIKGLSTPDAGLKKIIFYCKD